MIDSSQLQKDQKFLSYSLNLSRKHQGLTAPNPNVSCVIVKNNEIISTGVTAKNGRPHAEAIAIENAIQKFGNTEILNGATIYVTLEPCAHHAQTAPCSDLIIQHKFSKVVIAAIDPDSRVNGKGIEKLKQAGIEVVYAESMQEKAKRINRDFFKSRQEEMPFVTIKIATTLDGKIASKTFDSKWITSEKARRFSHQLRSEHDAIMVGGNTVRKDNPTLNCRIAGLEEFSPKRIIISQNINFDLSQNIFQNVTANPTIVLTYEKNKDATLELEKKGVKIIFCDEINGKIDLKLALKQLNKFGINNLLVEGGANLITQFIEQKLFDEIVWIRANKILGDDGISAIEALKIENISAAINLEKDRIIDLGSDLIEIYRPS